MIIEELTLKNFKSHKNSKIDFNEGITVILGQNGAGKSTLLEAIRFALFKKVDGNIQDMVRKPVNAQYDVSTMMVKLKFKHNNIQYEIERIKKRSSSSSTIRRLSGDKTVQITNGEKQVTEEIEKIIGVDKNSFLNAVYIRQGEITSLIDKTASDRKELISKLLNLDNLEKSWKNMINIIKEYENKIELNDRLLANKEDLLKKEKENTESTVKITEELQTDEKLKEELTNTLKELEKEVESLNQKKEKYEKNRVQIESLNKTIDETKTQLNKEETLLKTIEAKEAENKSIEKEILKLPLFKDFVEIKDKYDDKRAKLVETEQDIGRINALNETLKNTKSDYEKSIEYSEKLETLNERQKMLKKDIEELNRLESSLTTINSQKGDLFDKLEQKAKAARNILNNPNLRNPEEISAEYTKQLDEKEKQQESLNNEIKECQLKISSNNTIITNTQKSLRDLKNTTDKCPICQSDISHEKHKSLVEEYNNTIQECEDSNKKINENIQDKNNRLKLVTDKISDIRTIEANSMIDNYNKFRNFLKEIKEINAKIESLKEKKEVYDSNEKNIEKLNENIKSLETNKQSYLTTQATLKELKNIEELESNKNSLTDEVNGLKIKLKEINQKVKIPDDIKASIRYLEEKEKVYNENVGFISNKENTNNKIKEMNNKLTKENNNLDNINRENRELSYDSKIHEKTHKEYTCTDKKCVEIEKKLVENKTKKEALEKEKSDIRENIKELEKLENEQVALNDYITLLNKIREMYGKDGVQRDLRENSKPQIELETNNIFNDFNFDYDNINLDENYEITITKSDEILNVSMLSGGEKIVIALALRLAIAKVISKQKNELLILDEPTVHLDEERKLELIEILRDTDIAPQMLIVTHDSELIGITENIIEIRKKDGVSTYVQRE
ncbi:MAG: AAA family ATPase [Methanosphaera sp.]|nr:AAA family ATPase [Methanosphaera sp.]